VSIPILYEIWRYVMKIQGTVQLVEHLRGGVRATLQLGPYGIVVLNGLSEEEGKTYRAGYEVELDVTVTPVEAPVEPPVAEEEGTPESGADLGYGAEGADAGE
jgi:hypothetical protein